jgi:hypothetical protein
MWCDVHLENVGRLGSHRSRASACPSTATGGCKRDHTRSVAPGFSRGMARPFQFAKPALAGEREWRRSVFVQPVFLSPPKAGFGDWTASRDLFAAGDRKANSLPPAEAGFANWKNLHRDPRLKPGATDLTTVTRSRGRHRRSILFRRCLTRVVQRRFPPSSCTKFRQTPGDEIRSPRLQPGVFANVPISPSPLQRATERFRRNTRPAAIPPSSCTKFRQTTDDEITPICRNGSLGLRGSCSPACAQGQWRFQL